MKKYPVFLNVSEIHNYRDSLKNVDKQIEYYNYIISVYKEFLPLKSDGEVKNYVDKYGLNDKIFKIEHDSTYDPKNPGEWYDHDDIFTKIEYNKLYEKASYLSKSLPLELNMLLVYKETICDDFKIYFYEEDFLNQANSLENNKERLIFVNKSLKKLETISQYFTSQYLNKVIKLYGLQNKFSNLLDHPKTNDIRNRIKFREYLHNRLIPSIRIHKDDIELTCAIERTKDYMSKGVTSKSLLYPLWNYNCFKIELFSESTFVYLQDKIMYYSYLVKKFKVEHPDFRTNFSKYPNLTILEEELKDLETTHAMEKSKKEGIVKPLIFKYKKAGKSKSITSKKNKPNAQNINKDKLIWLGTKEQLLKLLRGLQSYDYIQNNLKKDPDCEKLLFHFVDIDNKPFVKIKTTTKIRLRKNNADLIYIYSQIGYVDNNLLSTDFLWIKTEKVFLNKHGREMKHKNLSVSYDSLPDKERPKLDEIIQSVYQT